MRSFTSKISKNIGLVAVIAVVVSAIGGGSAVAGSMITGKQIKNSTVSGADIKNGTLGSADFNAAAKSSLQGPKGDTGSAGPIVSRSSAAFQNTTNTSFVNLTNGLVDVEVPSGATKLKIDFTAECSITHGSEYAYLYARIVVDGSPTSSPSDSALCGNTSDYNHSVYTGSSLQRVVDVAPGAHTVQVQFRTDTSDGVARLDDTVLSVQAGS